MRCGAKYDHLLVTEDGKTIKEPWTWYPNPMDYDDWYDVAHRVGREVYRRWHWFLSIEDRLSKLENPQPSEPYPERDQLTFMLQGFDGKLDELGHVLIDMVKHPEWTWEPAIQRAIAAAQDGTCVLELLDNAADYYQRPIVPETQSPRQPGTGTLGGDGGDPKKSSWGSVVITGALVAGGVAWWRKRNNKKRVTG